jgi:hypothetical protein
MKKQSRIIPAMAPAARGALPGPLSPVGAAKGRAIEPEATIPFLKEKCK